MSVLYDLKVDRDLLNYKFDGYKLTLDPLATHRLSLENDVESPKLPEDFFSYQHLKVYGVVNKLFIDPWNEDSLYFVDFACGIHCAFLDPKMNCSLLKERTVAKVPKNSQAQCRVATTLSFPDEEHAVVSNGAAGLWIYKTGKRREGTADWKVCYEGEPLGSDAMFLIQHSSTTLPSINSSTLPSIEVILTQVCRNDSTKSTSSHYLTKLHWLTLEAVSDSGHEVRRTRVLESPGAPEYGVVDAGRVFIASEKPVSFTHDSANAIIDQPPCLEDEASVEELQTSEADEKDKVCYNWTQNGREITLYMRLQEHVKSDDVTCDITTNHLRLSIKDGFLLDGELCAAVVVDACTWTLTDKNLLEVYLEKVDGEAEWREVVKGDARGHRVLDDEQVASINELLKPFESNDQTTSNTNVPFNLQQLEECDQLHAESAALYCFHGHHHQLLQKVNISNHQWLFSCPTPRSTTPSICLRHDVDGLIFQLNNPLEGAKGDWKNGDNEEEEEVKADDGTFSWQHTGTLHAFGYLQASKQQKKFTACSPDFSFVAIAEERKHVFIYRQPVAISTDLRNRKTSERVSRLAKQHLVSLECTQVVEGLVATKHRLFILTSQSLYCVQVVQE